jgi:hypothetical protein
MNSVYTFGAAIAAAFALNVGSARATQQPASEQPVITAAVAEASQRFAVPANWIRAVIQVESGGNTNARSPKGAIGLMQIMPATWTPLRLRYRLGPDAFDPHDNIFAGTALLRELFDRFGSSGFLAAYNGGPTRFLAYLAKGKPLAGETRDYLTRIAPLLGDDHVADAVRAPATLPDWRSAPLFLREAAMSANSLSAAARPADPGDIVRSRAALPSRLEAPSEGLFPVLAGRVSK